MEWLTPDLFEMFLKLLPGFLAATIFHALTPYPKRDVFDRLVAALIFTMFAGLAVAVIRWALLWVGGHWVRVGSWSTSVELGWGAVCGTLLGVAWSHAVTKGWTHSLLHRTGTTKKTSVPTQWFHAFADYERFVVLHYKDGRRLKGWPRLWPDSQESGHFLLEFPTWVADDGKEARMRQIEVLLIDAKIVEHVEFLRFANDPELLSQASVIAEADGILATTRKETKDGKKAESSKAN